MRSAIVGLVMVVGACRIDSVTFTQSREADAAIDTPMPEIEHHHYVIDRFVFPTSNVEARDYGMDLDGDAVVDNQLGMIAVALGNQDLENQIYTDKLINNGTIITLADVGATDLGTSSTASFALFEGANPMPAPCLDAQDTACRKHLTGTGEFTAKSAPVDPPLQGAVASGDLVAGPGHLSVQFAFFGLVPAQLTLLAARVDLMPTATGMMGKLTGAISKNDVDNVFMPSIQTGFGPIVVRDCTALTSPPSCGCMTDSQGKSLLGLFDTTPQDCQISVDEVRNNPIIVSLFAPDLVVEGRDALSFGVHVHAVGATYTTP
jgi:hypothetical protein